MASYAKAKLFPLKDVKSFEDWTTNQFGYKLYSIFFKTYTEKVWGMPCDEMSADWAAQRIKGLSPVERGDRRAQALASASTSAERRAGDQDAARNLPLSAAGPRHDVGSRARRIVEARRPCLHGSRPQATRANRIRRRPGRLADDRDRPTAIA